GVLLRSSEVMMISAFIVLLFGIPSPILITVGGAMLITRILPFLLQLFSRWTWKLEGGIIAFSFRNVLQRTTQATRAALLVSVVLAFSVAFITIPYNLDANTLDSYYYQQLGSDMIISSPTLTLNETFFDYLQDFMGVNSVSPIAGTTVRSPKGHMIKILGVDISTYAQTAFFRDDFLKQDFLSSLGRLDLAGIFRSLVSGEISSNSPDLKTLLSSLQSNISVLVQETNINVRNLNIGDQLQFDVEGLFNETSQEFDTFHFDLEIVGSFKYWPLFVDHTIDPTETNQDLFIILDLPALLNYVNAGMISLTEFKYLIRVNPGVSTAHIKEQIVNETGLNVLCIEEFQEAYSSSPQRNVLLTAINGSILILMTVTLFTILMFGFSQLMERNKEIGVERALGMSIRQTFLVFSTENMILTLFGTIVGLILGILIGQAFLIATLGIPTAPLPIISYPWELLFGVSLLVIIVGLISGQIPAFVATRVRISYILRGE
ncbi:MAG: ABC transporter permease, partial [Candidatus Hodarchaeota archaeon]